MALEQAAAPPEMLIAPQTSLRNSIPVAIAAVQKSLFEEESIGY